jgi:hypothetical protein
MMLNNVEEIEMKMNWGRRISFAAGKLVIINPSLFEVCAK